jgi:hypothetical protein
LHRLAENHAVKTKMDTPEEPQEAMRLEGAKTEREWRVVATEEDDRSRRLARLAAGLGSFDGLPSREELLILRSRS